jgi:hypothetical protein
MEVRGSDEPVVYPLKALDHALLAFSSGDASAGNAPPLGKYWRNSAVFFRKRAEPSFAGAKRDMRLKFVDTGREFLLPRGAKIPTLVASGQSFQHARGMFPPRAFN